MEDMILCHACKTSGPTVVATFSLHLPRNTDTEYQSPRASDQGPEKGSNSLFSGHMEMYYFTAEDEPVTIMETHLDVQQVCVEPLADVSLLAYYFV